MSELMKMRGMVKKFVAFELIIQALRVKLENSKTLYYFWMQLIKNYL